MANGECFNSKFQAPASAGFSLRAPYPLWNSSRVRCYDSRSISQGVLRDPRLCCATPSASPRSPTFYNLDICPTVLTHVPAATDPPASVPRLAAPRSCTAASGRHRRAPGRVSQMVPERVSPDPGRDKWDLERRVTVKRPVPKRPSRGVGPPDISRSDVTTFSGFFCLVPTTRGNSIFLQERIKEELCELYVLRLNGISRRTR